MIKIFLVFFFLQSPVFGFIANSSVVLVSVYRQPINFDYPWKKKSIVSQSHMGSIVKKDNKNYILISAYSLFDYTRIEFQEFFNKSKNELKPVLIDFEANLALLEPTHRTRAFERLKPLVLGDDVSVNSSLTILSAKNNLKRNQYSADLISADMQASATSSYLIYTYFLKSQGKGLGWSEPVFNNSEELVALTTSQSSNYIYATSVSLIKHFLDDDLVNYKGFPGLEINSRALMSNNMRTALNANHIGYGVWVESLEATSPFVTEVKSDDILTKVDGYEVNAQGLVEMKKKGFVSYMAILNNFYANDSIDIEIMRDAKVYKITKQLHRYDSNSRRIPHYKLRNEPYVIFGGLVFQELSLGFLKTWGSAWENKAPPLFLKYWSFENHLELRPKRIIILNRVLADQYNLGYDKLTSEEVVSVNGLNVDSLESLVSAFKKPMKHKEKDFFHAGLMGLSGEIILDYEKLNQANKRIAKNYGILDQGNFFIFNELK